MDHKGIGKDNCDPISFSPCVRWRTCYAHPPSPSCLSTHFSTVSVASLGHDGFGYGTLPHSFYQLACLSEVLPHVNTFSISEDIHRLLFLPLRGGPCLFVCFRQSSPSSFKFLLALLILLSLKNLCYTSSPRQRSTESTFSLSWGRERRKKNRKEQNSDFKTLPAIVLWSIAVFPHPS